MYRRLLVPLDGSAFAEHAIPLAISIAKRAGAEIEILHVHSPLAAIYGEGPVIPIDSLESVHRKHKEQYLDQVISRLSSSTSVTVRPLFFDGDIAGTIGRVAANTEVDLVVMTTHARGIIGRLWLGSVADELVRSLTLPLLLVPPRQAPADFRADRVLKHILLPLDGSAVAEQMITPASRLGELMGADYTLLRVIRPLAAFGFPLQGSELGREAESVLRRSQEVQVDLNKEARQYLDAVARKFDRATPTVRKKVVEEDQPAVAILRQAEAQAVDLIALETHGRRGLARMMLGSVADKVVRGASIPVLLHRPTYA
jgi:nucleotide-binding universal stress UspA family protein